ncbi:hypothetical protein Tco_0168485 [Tanacetum coccineum]
MAISVILVSSGSSEDNVGTPARRVILFETPIIAPTIPPSPYYTPTSPDYSPASDSESDPFEDPSSVHIPPLPAISPFLSSTDDTTDSDTPDTPPSPTHGTPFTEITSSTQRSPVIPRRRVMILAPGQPIPHGRPYRYHLNGPVHMMTMRKRVGLLPAQQLAVRHSVDHSSSDYFSLDYSARDSSSDSSSEASSDFHSDASSDSSSHDLPSTTAGPSRKRRRSPMTSVPALPRYPELYLLSREASLRDDVIVKVEDGDQRESEKGMRARLRSKLRGYSIMRCQEDTSEPAQDEEHIEVTYETLGDLVMTFHDYTSIPVHLERDNRAQGHVSVKSQRVDWTPAGMSRLKWKWKVTEEYGNGGNEGNRIGGNGEKRNGNRNRNHGMNNRGTGMRCMVDQWDIALLVELHREKWCDAAYAINGLTYENVPMKRDNVEWFMRGLPKQHSRAMTFQEGLSRLRTQFVENQTKETRNGKQVVTRLEVTKLQQRLTPWSSLMQMGEGSLFKHPATHSNWSRHDLGKSLIILLSLLTFLPMEKGLVREVTRQYLKEVVSMHGITIRRTYSQRERTIQTWRTCYVHVYTTLEKVGIDNLSVVSITYSAGLKLEIVSSLARDHHETIGENRVKGHVESISLERSDMFWQRRKGEVLSSPGSVKIKCKEVPRLSHILHGGDTTSMSFGDKALLWGKNVIKPEEFCFQ